MKKEGWTPGYVIKKTDEFLSGLPTNPDFIYQKNGRNFKKATPKRRRYRMLPKNWNA